MSELNVYHHELRHNEYAEFYLKYEADKVIADLEESHKMEVEQLLMEIAEKDAEIARLNDKLRHYPMMAALIESGNKEIAELKADYKAACDRLQTANLIKDEQLAATRHNKYKRCMAMASKCRLRARWFGDNAFYKKEQWALQWHRRWLELAEKLKDE